MTWRSLSLFAMLALALSACGSADRMTGASAPQYEAAPAMPEEAPATGGASAAPGDGASKVVDTAASVQQTERMVIKTATMTVQVNDLDAVAQQVLTQVGGMGGFIVDSQTSGTDDYRRVVVRIRVPSDRFDALLEQIKSASVKVSDLGIKGQDVTEEYVDLESHKKTLTATRDRLLELLAKSQTVEDTLKVNEALNEYQAQIDEIEGRMKYLSQSASLSTVDLTLMPVPSAAPIVSADGWQPMGVARDALRSLVEFGQGLASVLIVLLVWSPVWGLVLLAGWLISRKLRGKAVVGIAK
ncbi:DUF4349 domain-containing protein [Chloroflexia bacterium SDU3-3]|nr:DUF4349 domain-containing protein [Chloroflexia bacterium SDU3-3]